MMAIQTRQVITFQDTGSSFRTESQSVELQSAYHQRSALMQWRFLHPETTA